MALFQQFNQQKNRIIELAQDQSGEARQEEGFIILIVGLGNVGKEFEGTRHNSGFMALDAYAKANQFPKWQEKKKFKALITEDFVAGKKIVLAKPTTLYNLSGESVRALKDFYKVDTQDIIVIHDELDLPFGTIREKQGGGSAGSNGLKSIISQIGGNFKRIRIGIKNDLLEKIDPADFVLSKFTAAEKKQLDAIIEAAMKHL